LNLIADSRFMPIIIVVAARFMLTIIVSMLI